MGRLLGLFVQHKAIGVSDQRSVVRVKEHLVWKLCGDQEEDKDMASPCCFCCTHVRQDYSDTHTYFWTHTIQWALKVSDFNGYNISPVCKLGWLYCDFTQQQWWIVCEKNLYMRLALPSHTASNCQSQRWADGRESLCRQNAGHPGWICSRKRPHDPGPQSGWETQNNHMYRNMSGYKHTSFQQNFNTCSQCVSL